MSEFVMAGLVPPAGPQRTFNRLGADYPSAGRGPAIHVFLAALKKDVDARDIGERSDAVPSNGYARA
jgi:hypothetical protein